MHRHALVPFLLIVLAPTIPAQAAPWADAAGDSGARQPALTANVQIAERLNTAQAVTPPTSAAAPPVPAASPRTAQDAGRRLRRSPDSAPAPVR